MFCVSCKKYMANENSSVRKTKQNRLMLSWNCVICGEKKLTSIKNQKLHYFNNICLKWIKSLTNFHGLETNSCQNCISNRQALFLVDLLLGFTKHRERIRKLEEQVV